MWGSSEETGGCEERLPLPTRARLHQAEESQPGTHRLQLQTEHQGETLPLLLFCFRFLLD